MDNYITTDHLQVFEVGGSVSIMTMPDASLFDSVGCGRITKFGDDRCYWPEQTLGAEPDWFAGEVELLCREVERATDEARNEAARYVAQVCWDYDSSRGL